MTITLDHLLEELGQTIELYEIQDWILRLRGWLGIDQIVCNWVSADGEQFGFGSYPPEWARHYIKKEYVRIDPVILGCFHRFHPVDWKRLDWSSKAARSFRKDVMDFGVGNQGYSVPIRGPNGQFALFTVSHSYSNELSADLTVIHQRSIILIAHYLNQKTIEVKDG